MVRRRRGEFRPIDDPGRRVCSVVVAGPIITGPMFFTTTSPFPFVRLVEFTSPEDHAEKSNLG